MITLTETEAREQLELLRELRDITKCNLLHIEARIHHLEKKIVAEISPKPYTQCPICKIHPCGCAPLAMDCQHIEPPQ